MKSTIVENVAEDVNNYSELQVMHSNAGYYLGTIYHDPEGFDEPGSRDSDYFKTKKEAEDLLKSVIEDEKIADSVLRKLP